MGSFAGHILPGIFFLSFGVWWTFAICSSYFKFLARKSSSKKNVEFLCTPTFRSNCCPGVCLESILKLTACVIGMIGEFVTGFDHGKFTAMNNSQHITMYLFFGINGLVDVLLFYGYPLPLDSDYMTMALACVIEAILFAFHLHGRSPLDIHVHTLLILAIVATVAAVLVEWKHRNNVLSCIFRTMCTLLQGTWFCQVGFILYPPFSMPKVDENSHKEIMLITAKFCWHIAAIVFFIGIVGYIYYLQYKALLNSSNVTDNFPGVQYSKFDNEEHIMFERNGKTENLNQKNKFIQNGNYLNNIESAEDDL